MTELFDDAATQRRSEATAGLRPLPSPVPATDSEGHPVRYEHADGIAVVTMSDDVTRNALSVPLLEGLDEALAASIADRPKSLLIRSSGRSFSSGGDLAGLHRALERESDGAVEALLDQFHAVIRRIRSHPVPVVAALNGPVIGAGMALALAADARVASDRAYYVTGYLAVGASPDGGTSMQLTRALGAPRALASLLLNRRFAADELLALGMVDQVVAGTDLDAAAMDLAARLGSLPGPTVHAARRLIEEAAGASFDSQLELEKSLFVEVSRTADFKAAIASFARPSR